MQVADLERYKLFTAKCIDSFAWMRKEELLHVLNSILESHRGNKPVDVRTLTSTFGFNNITRILWSKRYYGDDATAAEAVEFKNLLHDVIELVIKPCIGNLVPWYLRWLDWQIPHYRSIHAKQEKFMGGIIQEHMNTTRGSKDFLDMMIEFYGTDPQGQKHIKANLTEMLLAGTDTSAATSEWFMAAMMHNPHILLKVQAELDRVVGKSRMVQESDIPNLEYFHLVLKEIFRCYSPVALIMPRQAAESIEVAGYHIPKGTNVLINAWAVHMDPATWDNPTEFLPERFLGSSIDFKGQGFGLIPFGAGRRKCPGLQLGLRTVELLVANLIHGFEWSFVPGTKNSLEEVFNSACYLKTPLHGMATPRLSPEVYSNV